MEQQDSFQAAIDYLIANRKKPVFTNQGLFTQPAQPAPETKPSVVTGLFGDEYIRKNRNRDSGDSEFMGNPNSEFTPRNGLSSLTDAARYRDMASGIRNNQGAISAGFGLLSQANPLFAGLGVAARYGAPALLDYLGDRSYNRYGQEMQQIGGELFNPANPNFDTLAYNQPNYDAYRSDSMPVDPTNTPYSPAYDFNYAGGSTVVGGEPGVGIDSGSFDSGGGGYTDAGGGSFDYSADTGYDR